MEIKREHKMYPSFIFPLFFPNVQSSSPLNVLFESVMLQYSSIEIHYM